MIILICDADNCTEVYKCPDNTLVDGMPAEDWWWLKQGGMCEAHFLFYARAKQTAAHFQSLTTLMQMRSNLAALVGESVHCFDCGATVTKRSRALNKGQVLSLGRMYRHAQVNGLQEWMKWADVAGIKGREEYKMQWWGLIENSGDRRSDGAPEAGLWRLTPHGANFAAGTVRVLSHAVILEGNGVNELIGLTGKLVSPRDVAKFAWDELMHPQYP